MKTEKNAKSASGKKPVKSLFDEKPKQDDLSQLIADVKERPIVYGGIAAFLLVCLLAGFLWRANAVAKRKDIVTAYAQALDKQEPAERFAALEPLTQGVAKNSDEVIYMAAETAYKAGQYDKAKASFDRLRADFKSSPFTADAVEGLGYIAENSKDYDAAVGYYKEVQTTWSDSFAARRQPMNIARVEEQRGKLAEAIAAYNEQLQLFPGSTLAAEATAALTRLEKSNPELFPKAEPITPALTTPVTPGSETPAPVAPDTSTPSLDMKLQEPDLPADGTAPAASGQDVDVKLKMPELGGAATEPADQAATAPADGDLGELGDFPVTGSGSSASSKN
ncbi:MAG: tetratricopeptide repeat protein [Candidatus Hydrogenedentes bacterium]|nr:tetratricopeptide repeat protein [Candidatus Hydrogenedentota bacterium]